jgi:DNA invertase Pin-like site-specific DNA recombinase
VKPRRVALYARVSTGEQDVAMQLEELRRVAAARGWKVVGEYRDEGASGARRDRHALQSLEFDVREGKVDVVAV